MKKLLVITLAMLSGLATAKTQTGIASYYADFFNGRLTANGERFSNSKVNTAASKTLKFGTKVKVINLKNNKSIVVRINDRGPYVKGRIIDLTKAGAKELGMLNSGIAKVKLEILYEPKKNQYHRSK